MKRNVQQTVLVLNGEHLRNLDNYFMKLCLLRNKIAFKMLIARKNFKLATSSRLSIEVFEMDSYISHLRWLLLIDYIQPSLDFYLLNGSCKEFIRLLQSYKDKLEDRKNLWGTFNSPFTEVLLIYLCFFNFLLCKRFFRFKKIFFICYRL